MWSRDRNLDSRPGAIFEPNHIVTVKMVKEIPSSSVKKVTMYFQLQYPNENPLKANQRSAFFFSDQDVRHPMGHPQLAVVLQIAHIPAVIKQMHVHHSHLMHLRLQPNNNENRPNSVKTDKALFQRSCTNPS